MIEAKQSQIIKYKVESPERNASIFLADDHSGYFCTGARYAVQLGMGITTMVDIGPRTMIFAQNSFYNILR